MPHTCRAHQWDHPTESCPYCRETGTASNTHRAKRLAQAIAATIEGDASRVTEWFTHDVVGSGPVLAVSSRDELAADIEERDGTFTDVEIAFAPLDVSGAQAGVEGVASAVPPGPLVRDDRRDRLMVPSGRRIRMRAITVAEFEGDRICSFRSYWDDLPALQDLRELRAG